MTYKQKTNKSINMMHAKESLHVPGTVKSPDRHTTENIELKTEESTAKATIGLITKLRLVAKSLHTWE